ncbi:hypothetical protein [Meridianimarinicoccus aquatilis]|uniref:hypothetical protein n=1 Tax=Meridianimarinicoccus aquatilis TaxID=2552766 RepID=UPI00105A0F45|nr:hypothetical protein [Fluviibacterium aquatile]
MIQRPLSKISRHPVLNVLVGFVLMFMGIDEFLQETLPDYKGFFEVHHAVILIGLTMALKGLIEMGERLEFALAEYEAKTAAQNDQNKA